MKHTALFIVFSILLLGSTPSFSSESSVKITQQDWDFDGMLGHFDKAAMQRGLKVYREVCSACHSMRLLSYRNLTDLGYDEDQVKAIAADYSVIDGPDDEGEMFDRPARPSDRFVSPYPNKNAAKAVNNGAFPPDLSLITKARRHGPDYVYGLLTGYEDPPKGTELLDGQSWNKYMPGHVIAMAPPLSDGVVSYEDGSPETTQQYAYDVVNFLAWAAEPHLEQRKRMGISVLIFLIVFACVMYGVKRQIWKDQH